MAYKKIPHDENKSIKLKYHDIEAVHWLFHVEGWKIPEIADIFKVSYTCIKYHLMTDEQKKERNDQCAEANRRRMKQDINYRKRIFRRIDERQKEYRRTREDYRQHCIALNKRDAEYWRNYRKTEGYKKSREKTLSRKIKKES